MMTDTPNPVDLAEQNASRRTRMGDLKVRPGAGIVIETVTDLHTFATYAVAHGMAPFSFKNRDGSWDTHGMTIALIKGMEVGMKPTQSLQNIAVINNQPTIYGDAVPGLAFATGQVTHFREHMTGMESDDNWTACCELQRKGMDTPLVATFSTHDAKRAGLWGKTSASGKPTPWVLYPGRMLMWRARSWAFRALFADALKGLGVFEEVIDIDVEPKQDEAPQVGQAGLLHAIKGRTVDADTGEGMPEDAGLSAEDAERLRNGVGS